MTLDILICTIDEGVSGIGAVLMPPMPDVHYVVSVQYTTAAPPVIADDWPQRPDVTLTTIAGRGLSHNRNNAIAHATADIILTADDDCRYTTEYIHTAVRAFTEHPEADIICFCAESYDGRPMKRYPPSAMSYDAACRKGYYATSMEIAFRRTSIEHAAIAFNTDYGLGAPHFTAGEEDIFLADAARAGLTTLFVPEVVTRTDPATTGDGFLADARLQTTKGAVFRYRFGLVSALWRTLKEGAHHLIYNHRNPLPIWRNMLHGIRQSKKDEAAGLKDKKE